MGDKKKQMPKKRIFKTADEDARYASLCVDEPQCQTSSYQLAYQDPEFLLRDELRPVRLQLELLKPELTLQAHRIESTVVVYGSARFMDEDSAEAALVSAQSALRDEPDDPKRIRDVAAARRALENSRYYEEARRFGHLVAKNTRIDKLVVITGGGPGIMEAANRGAHEAGVPSIGMNIVLPHEQVPNSYITPDLNFLFHYFAIRKMHLLMRAKGLVAFPGGFGTMDELFETLTLIQTGKIEPIPVLLFGRDFWERVVNFDVLVEEGTISEKDLDLFSFVETAEEAWKRIATANGLNLNGETKQTSFG
jgi:hypothetical protein